MPGIILNVSYIWELLKFEFYITGKMRDAEAEEEYKEEISTLRKNIEHLRAELWKERLEIENWEKKHAAEEEKHKITREELNKEKEAVRALKVKLTMSEARRDLS